jgi:hypothetical protein
MGWVEMTERPLHSPESAAPYPSTEVMKSTISSGGWPGWWGGPEYLAWLEDQPEADSTVLMGSNTYRLMSGLATDGEPGTDALAGLSKIVSRAP